MADNRTKTARPPPGGAEAFEPARAAAVSEDVSQPERVMPPAEATPSMAQFLEIKAANPDSLLWYRMGDFYELFFDDAAVAAKALGIVLTKRGKHQGQDIPMCGVPVHRADEYLQRLIRLGSPRRRLRAARGSGGSEEARGQGRGAPRRGAPRDARHADRGDAARREIAQLPDRPLPGAGRRRGTDFRLGGHGGPRVARHLDGRARDRRSRRRRTCRASSSGWRPGKCSRPTRCSRTPSVRRSIELAGAAATPVPAASFDSLAGERGLKAQLGLADLGAFGGFSRAELAALAAVLRYVDLTQIGKKPVVRPPKRTGSASVLMIDAASRASLELVRSISGDKGGSLLAAIDRTVTGAGARELAARLTSPLRDPQAIETRLDAVQLFVDDETLREDVRASLKGAPDIARAVAQARVRARRAARSRGDPRRARASCRRTRRSSSERLAHSGCRRTSRTSRRGSRRRAASLPAIWLRRWSTILRT